MAWPTSGQRVELEPSSSSEEVFTFKTNEFVMFIGSSGSGKTTTVGLYLALMKPSLEGIEAEILFVTESPEQRFFMETLPRLCPDAKVMSVEEFSNERLGGLQTRTQASRPLFLVMDDVLIAAEPKERERIVSVLLQQTKRLQHSNLTLWLTLHGEVDKTVKNFAELKATAKVIVYPLGTGAADISGLSQASVDVKFKLSPELRGLLKLLVGRLKQRVQLLSRADETDDVAQRTKLYRQSYIVCATNVVIISKNNNSLYDGLSLNPLTL